MNRQEKLKLLREFRDLLMHDKTRSRISDRASENLFFEIRRASRQVSRSISYSAVQRVFEAWTDTLPPGTRRAFTTKRSTVIKKALKQYPIEDVILAVQAWVHDPWEGRAKFNDVLYLLRDDVTIERFRDMNLEALKSMAPTTTSPSDSVLPDGAYNLDRSHRWSTERGCYVRTDQWEPSQ